VVALGALVVLVLAWDVFLAGHVAQLRATPSTLAVVSAFAALLIVPAVVVEVAGAGGVGLDGRTVNGVAWVWPLTVALCAAQALYATLRRMVAPALGVPIVAYDLLLFAIAVTRYLGADGGTPPDWAQTLGAAYASALGTLVGPASLSSPYVLLIPLVAPAFPARWPFGRPIRVLVALVALAWVALIAGSIPSAADAVRSYDRYATESLEDRPSGDFSVGIRVLPPLNGAPEPAALRGDLALVDSTGAEAISIVVDPDGAHIAALDSLARALDQLRRDSTILIVTLGYPRMAAARLRQSPRAYDSSRVADLERIARQLDPDYMLPADEPYGRGAQVMGTLPVGYWEHYLEQAAVAAHRVNSHIKIAVAIAAFNASDSALYAWAASPDSPLDAVGFTFFPGFAGATTLDARLRTADRWIARIPAPAREQWVFAAGGYPMAHGEESQERAVWGALAWATAHSGVKGLIVAQSADYGALTGLRAANGRLRPAVAIVTRAARTLRQSAE